MEVAVGILFIVIIVLLISFWYVTVPIAVLIFVICLGVKGYKKAVEDERQRQAERARRRAEEEAQRQRHEYEQQECHRQMITVGEQSVSILKAIPSNLKSADQHLTQAEADFAEGAFSPFWDSIEKAVTCIGGFDEGIRRIKDNSLRYTQLIVKYEDTPPEFPFPRKNVEKLSVAKKTAERMSKIVRKAQRNFQFATIYEQRKTNQLLVAGFTSLGQALNEMTNEIVSSIDDLAGTMDSMTSTLNESMQRIHSRMGDMVSQSRQQHEESMGKQSEKARRDEDTLRMLDNIQHHRKPPLL